MEGPVLDRQAIEDASRRLGDRLALRGVVADIHVFNGRAMALAYDAQRTSRDIDTIFQPHCIVVEEAQSVAAELGLPQWWLNEQSSVYVAPREDVAAPRVFNHPGLRVSAASPEHLLTLKMLAAHRTDAADIEFLVNHLRLSGPDDVFALVAEIFPEEETPHRARLLLADIFGEE